MNMRDYRNQVIDICRSLGIPDDYSAQYGLEMQPEETNLVEIENDIFERPQKLYPDAANAWKSMQNHAKKKGINLFVVSGFRPVNK